MSQENDIAIVGMSIRVPGARNRHEYWRNLTEGVESVRAYSDEELREVGVSETLLANPRYVKSGLVLDDLEQFDADFFGFGPKEAAIMDPQHRHFLECAWEALEDAGQVPEKFDGAIGVYAGCGMGAYFAHYILRNRELLENVGLFLLRHTGNDKDFLATRVWSCFDLRGPSVNVQTACSTSLVAAHFAIQALLSGECDMALAGGVTIDLPHRQGYVAAEGEILAPDGHCRAFDHRAKGTLFGSGAGVVVLRRLEDAVADGDHIHAVIKGSAINNDGAGKVGYFAPSVDGQAAAIAEAMGVSGVEPESIGYIECHGTGTAVGDPIEVAAMTQAFRGGTDASGFCGIGSVKTNIGHLDTAAGVASLVKAALAVSQGVIPPSLNYEAPNPRIDFAGSPFFVNDELREWQPRAGPRRAGVNSLGVGGTNAHLIVEQPPARAPAEPTRRDHHLIALSARSKRAVEDQAAKLAAFLRDEPDVALEDVAYTLMTGRRAFRYRRVFACRDRDEAIQLLENPDPRRVHTHEATDDTTDVVFMFPGGGSQYRHMGRDLYAADPVFRRHIDRGLGILEGQLDVDVRELWLGDSLDAEAVEQTLDRPSVQLPMILLCEYALAQSWIERGIEPKALLGHSMGENTAACIAGVFTFEDVLGLVVLRGKLFETVEGGGMVSVPLSRERAEATLDPALDLATVNAPELCVVSGPTNELSQYATRLEDSGVEVQRVKIAIAAHSRLLEPILEEFGAYLRGLDLQAPKIPFVSNRTGDWIEADMARDPEYWVEHLRRTIHFSYGVRTLISAGHRVFLEVGPGRTLTSLVRQHSGTGGSLVAIPSMRHPDEILSDVLFMTASWGQLWAGGLPLDLAGLYEGEARQRVPLPTYAFQHRPYWIDPDPVDAVAATEPLTQKRIEDVADWTFVDAWKAAPLPAERRDAERVLVFVDDVGVGGRVADTLRTRGHDVVVVRSGDAYGRTGEREFTIAPELGREGFDALVQELVAAGLVPTSILHLWGLTVDRSARPGSNFFHRCQEQGFWSLFFLAQAISAEEAFTDVFLTVAANGVVQVDPHDAVSVEKATVIGPCLVAPREIKRLGVALVDLDSPIGSSTRPGRIGRRALRQAVEALVEEVECNRASGIFARRRGVRSERIVRQESLGEAAAGERVLPIQNGCYVVTGGFGGIGSAVAEWLARDFEASLVLIGRRELPAVADWDETLAGLGPSHPTGRAILQIRRLESMGARVLPVSGDVADVIAMRDVVQEARTAFGRIHGLVHAAGVVDDGVIAAKDQASIENVLAPKVHGTQALLSILDEDPLDFAVLFSSTSVLLGAPGQVDYVSANAYLDAVARERSRSGKPTIAVRWGVWRDVGMAAAAIGLGEGEAVALGATEPCDHPLFEDAARRQDVEVVLQADYSTRRWILDEHRAADGLALVPGTGVLEMVLATVRAAEGGARCEIRDLFFFRPLVVQDGETRAVRARARRSLEGYEVDVQSSSVLDDGRLGWQSHAQARVLMRAVDDPAPVDIAAFHARCSRVVAADADGVLRSPQERFLRLGPRWRVLREVRYGSGEAIARLALGEDFSDEAADFVLHPALLDFATGFAMELIAGYCADHLWVPLSYGRMTIFHPLGAEVCSVVRRVELTGADVASFDLSLCSPDGRVLVEVERFAIKRLEQTEVLRSAPVPSGAEVELAGTAGAGGGGESRAEQLLREHVLNGIDVASGVSVLGDLLRLPLVSNVTVSSLPVDGLRAQLDRLALDDAVGSGGGGFARPDLDIDYVEPRDDVEKTLVGMWQELLGVEQVGVKDSFFDLGGHSLIAVRMFSRIRKTFRVDFPISMLFEASTVEACADRIREAAGDLSGAAQESKPRSRYRFLVPMHSGEPGPSAPFFLVAGMFGNVLNLRHLAQLVGRDRGFYGLQARGLFGDMEPHATFVEAARDYIAEVRQVQPEGPYHIGGFSGGGITAFEIARQLREEGEDVAMLVLLDTPLPERPALSRSDRLAIKVQDLKHQGPGFFPRWARDRIAWEVGKVKRRFAPPEDDDTPVAFHSLTVERAFRGALDVYDVQHLPIAAWLFRPVQDQHYDLGGSRYASRDKEIVLADNGWTPFVDRLEVIEVPGDHDGMVLEPNVRSLATGIRKAFQQCEAAAGSAGDGGAG